jgi:hypothetical protein
VLPQGQERSHDLPLFVCHVTGISWPFVQDSLHLPFGWIGLFFATILPNGNFQMTSKVSFAFNKKSFLLFKHEIISGFYRNYSSDRQYNTQHE